MSKFKHAALALVAASLMAVQAQATEVQAQSPQAMPVATFSQADINTMFEVVAGSYGFRFTEVLEDTCYEVGCLSNLPHTILPQRLYGFM